MLFALYTMLSAAYDGVVVAKVPFEPYDFVKRLSQRSLPPPGDDDGAGAAASFRTDCAMPFLYALCTLAFRTNIQKLLGTAPPQTGNAFALAAGEEMRAY